MTHKPGHKQDEDAEPMPVVSLEAGAGPDALVLKVAQDAYRGSAQYTVEVDNVQVGGIFTASASHAAGETDTLTLRGDWAAGGHDVEVTFLNDFFVRGGRGGDRNLYVESGSYNGAPVPGADLDLLLTGTKRFAFTDAGSTEPPPPPPPPPPGGVAPNAPVSNVALTFQDEFTGFNWSNGEYVWNPATNGSDWEGPPGWITVLNWNARHLGAEQEYYSMPDEAVNPFSIINGALRITAAPSPDPSLTGGQPYTSGVIASDEWFAQKYGYFEMRADVTAGQGLWPAFWIVPNDKWPPELDVVEIINDDPIAHHALHTNQTGRHTSVGDSEPVPDLFTGMHTFGVSWRPDKIEWFVDGRKTFEAPTPADMHEPLSLIANMAVGGGWPGPADATTPFPATMDIDYIRAWQYNDLA